VTTRTAAVDPQLAKVEQHPVVEVALIDAPQGRWA
jgi:hypothetical protein